jgi:hypothetical protein
MTTRVKSALLLGITLLIGGVLGAVLNAYMAERRFERVGIMRSRSGMAEHIQEAIGPMESSQAAQVRDILDRHLDRMDRHMTESQAEGRAIMDSMNAELQQVLTPEQIERLEEQMRRRGPGGGRGPGGRGRGGSRDRHDGRSGPPERGPR